MTDYYKCPKCKACMKNENTVILNGRRQVQRIYDCGAKILIECRAGNWTRSSFQECFR